jgi:hypothetical protein
VLECPWTSSRVKNYGQIDKKTLKTQCEQFRKVGQPDAQSWAKQNNMLMSVYLAKSLTAVAQARALLTRKTKLLMAPSMLLRCSNCHHTSCNNRLRPHYPNLSEYSAEFGCVCSDSQWQYWKKYVEFDKNHSQINACGATNNDPIGILFDAYSVVPCYNFKKYVGGQHEDYYLDGKLTTF